MKNERGITAEGGWTRAPYSVLVYSNPIRPGTELHPMSSGGRGGMFAAGESSSSVGRQRSLREALPVSVPQIRRANNIRWREPHQ